MSPFSPAEQDFIRRFRRRLEAVATRTQVAEMLEWMWQVRAEKGYSEATVAEVLTLLDQHIVRWIADEH